MLEFRYQGRSMSGRLVQGVLNARNRREALQRIDELCRRRHFQLVDLQRKNTYVYTARHGNEKPVRGEQQAFCKEEVENGLRKLNFRDIRVREKWLNFRLKPPSRDIVLFIRMCADLLRQRFPYDEILTLLSSDIENRTLSKTIREIRQDLKDGKDGRAVYMKHADVLGLFTAYMLSVASSSGNMVDIYDSTAKFLERDEEFRKSLKSALIMPGVVVIALIGATAYYVGYIFPSIAEMFLKMGIDLPVMTQATLDMSHFLRANILWLSLAFLAPILAAVLVFRSPKGREFLDRWIIRVPVIGALFHKTSIEIFARVFHALYTGSGENVVLVRLAAEACRNRYMERRIKDVALPMMIRQGEGLVEALERTDVFTSTAISRFRAGQQSGSLRHAALQLADYYERETSYKMKNVVEFINVVVSLLLMILITALTLVSSETAAIRPKTPNVR